MNYINFKNDLNNLKDYLNYKFCLDQMIYAFNDKYNQLHNELYYEYINKYYSENSDDDWHKIMKDLSYLKNHGFRIYLEEIINLN